ncbi:MAG: hypothetical protein KDC34_14735 [Saprospiraceae bacterium]|nr:hypothetical protein [Saprospiraceae bacterium]
MHSLFDGFSPVSKADWLDKVARDLKGRSIEELNHQWTEQIQLSPFFHLEDSLELPPLVNATGGNWEIGSCIQVEDPAESNAILLDELQHGVNAPRLVLKDPLSAKAWEVLLNGVEPAYISLQIYPTFQETEPASWLDPLLATLSKKGVTSANRVGAIRIGEEAIEKVLVNWNLYQERFPRMRKLYIDNSMNFRTFNPEQELALAAYMAFYRLEEAISKGVDAQEAHDNLHVVLAVGTSFFRDLAKLRAFRILWANLLQAAALAVHQAPFISVQFAPESQDEDMHTNMIRATTQAMSAVIGGADHLEILPANATVESTTGFTRRVARNLHHILSMEAHLDQVMDPAAGSYFMETLSVQIAEKAYAIFREMKSPFR